MPFDPDAYPAEELASSPQQLRINAAYEEMAVQERTAAEAVKREMDLMTEARVRFAKAALYEQIIEGRLFEGDDPITIEVENELKAHAEMLMRKMLNLETEKEAEAALLPEEVGVLKLFAAKLLGRPAAIPRPPEAQKAAPKPLAIPTPQPGTLAAPKRGRGRPPGTGKNQIAAREAARQQQEQRQSVQDAVRALNARNQPVAPRPDPVATNKPKAGKNPHGQVVDTDAGPLPMPSPDEMIAQAAEQGERGLKAQEALMRAPGAITPTNHTVKG